MPRVRSCASLIFHAAAKSPRRIACSHSVPSTSIIFKGHLGFSLRSLRISVISALTSRRLQLTQRSQRYAEIRREDFKRVSMVILSIVFARYANEPNVHSCKRTLPAPNLGGCIVGGVVARNQRKSLARKPVVSVPPR